MTQLTYLRDRTVHQIRLDTNYKIVAHARWDVSGLLANRGEFSGLTCFRDNQFLMSMTQSGIGDKSRQVTRSIVIANFATRTIEYTLQDSLDMLFAPVASPNRKFIAILHKSLSGKEDAIAIQDLESKQLTIVRGGSLEPATSWSSDGKLLYLSRSAKKGGALEVVSLDIARQQFHPMFLGTFPILNHRTSQFAYLSEDRLQLLISPSGNSELKSITGFYKLLVGWRGDDEVFYVTGRGYRDWFGAINLATNVKRNIRVPGNGEIGGACLAKED